MIFEATQILKILDRTADACAFPMLDNAYVHLSATRMSLFCSKTDWALVIEIFGYCYKTKLPDLSLYTFASTLYKRDTLDDYVTEAAYRRYLAENPHNEFRLFCPVKRVTGWDLENPESIANTDGYVHLRNSQLPLPSPAAYAELGIPLKAQGPDMIALSRYLAGAYREKVLATDAELRVSVLPEMTRMLQLDAWHHPDLAAGELPGDTETFRQVAQVLASGDTALYRPPEDANTHWKHWIR